MRKIGSLEDLEGIFKNLNKNVIGIGVTAFNRLGPEKFIPGYRIVCLSHGRDLEMIRKDVKVFSAEESDGQHLDVRRNSASVIRLESARKFIRSFEDPYILLYKVTEKTGQICDEEKWKIIGNRRYEEMDNKAFLREILDKCGLRKIPGEICSLKGKGYAEFRKRYGNRIAIQLLQSGGGKGTFFVRSARDFGRARKKFSDSGEVLVTRFIEGPSPSLTGCVTRHGVIYTNLQYQLLDIPEVMNPEVGNGVFCGHDWTSSDDFTPEVQKQAYDYAEKIGNYLKGMGYRGIFGLDMVIDGQENRIYVTELNPRLLGSFPLITMVHLRNSETPLIMFHIMEFLEIDYEMNLEKINELVKKTKKGTHLILYNKWGKVMRNRDSLRPGFYSVKDGKLAYRRPGHRLEDLREDEFLVADDPPFRNTPFRPHERILRIATINSIMDRKTRKLNGWGKKVVGLIYRELDLTA